MKKAKSRRPAKKKSNPRRRVSVTVADLKRVYTAGRKGQRVALKVK